MAVNDIDDAIFLLEQQHSSIELIINNLKIQDLNKHQLTVTLLYNEIVYLSSTCIFMLKTNRENIIALPIIIRSLFEYTVELMMLAKDGTYLDHMLLNSEEQELKFLQEAQKQKFDIIGIDDLDKKIQETKAKIETSKDKIKHIMRFEKKVAELAEMYGSDFKLIYLIYRKLCAHTHPQLIMMTIKYKDASSPFTQPKFSETEYLVQINFISQILLYALNEIKDKVVDFPIENIAQFAKQIKEIVKINEGTDH